jgi:hypothetical protein
MSFSTRHVLSQLGRLSSVRSAGGSSVRSAGGLTCKSSRTANFAFPQQVRWFKTESEYHPVADQALDTIQDAIDEVMEATSLAYELDVASGVLTFILQPHGTWVINVSALRSNDDIHF